MGPKTWIGILFQHKRVTLWLYLRKNGASFAIAHKLFVYQETHEWHASPLRMHPRVETENQLLHQVRGAEQKIVFQWTHAKTRSKTPQNFGR